ncbi:MAG: penicillin-binding protein 2, partial [Clostridia bacterium]|nr:penicillin-binding protein 2 [Clostridia bacterium]
ATPMHIARLIATIANDGVSVCPALYHGMVSRDMELSDIRQPSQGERIISEQTAKLLQAFMHTAVQSGTASRGASDKVSAAAKTGTAQTGIMQDGHSVLQAWYAGYFPFEKPQYVCIVLVENGISGGYSAGPVFGYIADRLG